MRYISQTFPIESRVLFLWNSIALTGTIKSIAENSYGILCDSDKYTTDRLMIPRSGDEIFIPRDKCIKTGEIYPIRLKNGKLYKAQHFSNTKIAYEHLPKYSIYPELVGYDSDQLIKFTPENYLMKLTDGCIYIYTELGPGLVTLVDIHDTHQYRIPKWKYQKSVRTGECEHFLDVCEKHIEIVYEIPLKYRHQNAAILFREHKLNVVYDANCTDHMSVTHCVRTQSDVDFANLPNMIVIKRNSYRKKK